jgi:hypothetical protein
MGLINRPQSYTAGTPIEASEVNADLDTIYNEFNGSIAAANLATDAVSTAKIADSAVTTAKIASGAITPAETTTTYYQANVASSGGVTSSSFANFPTNRCKVDVVTTNANALVLVTYSAELAYAGATGSGYLRFSLSGANTGNSTYQRRAQNSDSGQELGVAYTQVISLATAGTTTIEMQIAGSSTANCLATSVVLSAVVLQDKG